MSGHCANACLYASHIATWTLGFKADSHLGPMKIRCIPQKKIHL
jgi:hypothetical protein